MSHANVSHNFEQFEQQEDGLVEGQQSASPSEQVWTAPEGDPQVNMFRQIPSDHMGTPSLWTDW